MKTYNIDITKDHCPMTFVKTRLKLDELKKGDTLEVLLNKGEPLENVPRSAKELGFTIEEVSEVTEPVYKVVIKK